jgi:metal-responsive CopG/Arc/MetJ family transcriptional regulator
MPEYKPRGRPKSEKPLRVRIHITLPPPVAAKLGKLSREQGRPMSEIISDAIRAL